LETLIDKGPCSTKVFVGDGFAFEHGEKDVRRQGLTQRDPLVVIYSQTKHYSHLGVVKATHTSRQQCTIACTEPTARVLLFFTQTPQDMECSSSQPRSSGLLEAAETSSGGVEGRGALVEL
jgi:hypothetical protein